MLYIRTDIESIDLVGVMTELSEQRRKRVEAMRCEHDRRQSIAAYLLLREALRKEYDIGYAPVFGYYDGGKPFISDRPDICFSLSHCRNGVACVLAEEPVGVDIESIRPYKPELARRVLNDAELAEVDESDRPDIEFIRLWTMKESYLKMTGSGIRSDLKQVPLSEACFETSVDMSAGYVCTVCRRKREE